MKNFRFSEYLFFKISYNRFHIDHHRKADRKEVAGMEGRPRQEAVCIGASSMTASGEGEAPILPPSDRRARMPNLSKNLRFWWL